MKKLMYKDLAILIIFLLTPVIAQSQNLVVEGDVKITGMNTARVTEYILVRGPGGVLAQRRLSDAIIDYFLKLPKGIQVLLDMGESPVKLINSGASMDDLYGKMYLGGLIFYIDDLDTVPFLEGLIAATEDQTSGAEWGCSGTLIGANGLGLGTGEQNTQIIEGNCAAGTAADICFDLSLNGFMDWYLPSKDELDQMYQKLYVAGLGSLTSGFYWSSSEQSSTLAWLQYFGDGLQGYDGKANGFNVRAIRSF